MKTIAKTLTIRLDEETHQNFKILSVKKGKDMTRILLEYINKLLEEESQVDKEK